MERKRKHIFSSITFTCITIDYNDESLDTLSFSTNSDVKKRTVMYVYISQENIEKKNGGGTRSVNTYIC